MDDLEPGSHIRTFLSMCDPDSTGWIEAHPLPSEIFESIKFVFLGAITNGISLMQDILFPSRKYKKQLRELKQSLKELEQDLITVSEKHHYLKVMLQHDDGFQARNLREHVSCNKKTKWEHFKLDNLEWTCLKERVQHEQLQVNIFQHIFNKILHANISVKNEGTNPSNNFIGNR